MGLQSSRFAAMSGEGRWGGAACPPPRVTVESLGIIAETCRLRHHRMGQGPTEPHAGHSTFLLSSSGAGGGYY